MYVKSVFTVTFIFLSLLKFNDADIISDVVSTSDKIVGKFLEDTNAALQDASRSGIRVVTDIDNALQSVISKIQEQVNITIIKLNEDIFNAVSGSGGAFEKIGNCTQVYAREVTAFETNLLNDTTGCIRERITSASNSVSNIINGTATLSEIPLTGQQVIASECPLSNDPDVREYVRYSVCVMNAVFALSSRVTENVAMISENVTTATILAATLSNLPADITLCFAARSAAALLNAAPLVLTITQCTITP